MQRYLIATSIDHWKGKQEQRVMVDMRKTGCTCFEEVALGKDLGSPIAHLLTCLLEYFAEYAPPETLQGNVHTYLVKLWEAAQDWSQEEVFDVVRVVRISNMYDARMARLGTHRLRHATRRIRCQSGRQYPKHCCEWAFRGCTTLHRRPTSKIS